MAFQPAPYPVPVWKRKHNMPVVTLTRGASEQRDHTNAMGTAITNTLCRDVLMNENPKNLIDAIKRNNPQPIDTRKSVDDFYEDGRARPSYLKRRVHESFPGTVEPNVALRDALTAALNEEGFNYANTLLVSCRDRMDPCHLFEKEDWAFPNETFQLGGLGGLPFSGRMGLEAALKRVPDGGCLLIEYCSHTGFDYEGTLGRVVRYDKQAGLFAPPIRTMREPLECYESLVGLPDRKTFGGDELEEPVEERVEDRVEEGKQDGGGNETGVQFGASPLPNDANYANDANDADAALAAARAIQKIRDAKEEGITIDAEFVGLFNLMKQRFNDVSSANSIHHYMAKMLQKIARQMFLDILDTTTLTKNVTCVFVGGVQLELPDPLEPYFHLLTFETRNQKGTMHCGKDKVLYHLLRNERHGSGSQKPSPTSSPRK
jgi:hypothetical protein